MLYDPTDDVEVIEHKTTGLQHRTLKIGQLYMRRDQALGLKIETDSSYIPDSREGILGALRLVTKALEYYPAEVEADDA